jgi:hypothetical protein
MKYLNIIPLFFVIISALFATTQVVKYSELDLRELNCDWFNNDENYKYAEGLKRARKFSEYVSIYSIAAYNAYDDDLNEIENIPFPDKEVWDELETEAGIEDEIGFAAKSWVRIKENGDKELIISYRGTDDFWKDFFKGNLVFIKGIFGRTQFDAALEYAIFIESMISQKNISVDRIILTGHSLGGGLAEYVQRLLPNSIAITFDPSPNQGRLYSMFSVKEEKDSVRLYERGEILAYFRYILSPDFTFEEDPAEVETKAIWVDFYDDDIMSAHSMRDLSISLIKVSASVGNTEALNVIQQIEARQRNYKLPDLSCEGNKHRRNMRVPQETL